MPQTSDAIGEIELVPTADLVRELLRRHEAIVVIRFLSRPERGADVSIETKQDVSGGLRLATRLVRAAAERFGIIEPGDSRVLWEEDVPP